MALKSILDDLDEAPEAVRDEYKETEINGKTVYVLDVDGIDAHPAVTNLKTAHERVKTDKRKLADDLSAANARLEGLPEDFNADAYEELRQQAEGKEPPKTDEQVTRVREQLERKHQAEVAKKDERIGALEGQIRKATIDDGLSKAMDEASIDPKHKPKLIPYLKAIGAIKLEEDGDTFSAVVDTDMGPLPLAKFVQDWAGSEDGKDYVAKPKGPGGEGNNGRGGATEVNPWGKDTHNLTQQGRMIQGDPDKARRMMRSAGLSDAQISQRIGA